MPRSLIALCASAALACTAKPAPTAPASPAPAPAAAAPAAPPAAAPASAAATTTKRIVLILGRVAGSSVITEAPDGTVTSVLDVVENGRGPRTDASIAFAADGTITKLAATGHHTFGAGFEVRFERTGDHVRWTSKEETGERDVTGPAFYMPIAEIPELQGRMVQAALRHGGSIAVLPSGTARVTKTGEATITANGATRTVVGYDKIGRAHV